jgi:hypothetical protein
MTFELYQNFVLVGIVLGMGMLLVTTGLFFYFHIPKVIGELTGITDKRRFRKLRQSKKESDSETQTEVLRGKPVFFVEEEICFLHSDEHVE